MELSERQALEAFVVDNDDLLALEEAIGRFNIFDALRIDRVEIRHSNFLAWLLDSNESHGQGDLFLKAILMDLLRHGPEGARPLSPVELDGVELRGVEVRREWRNIDLLIVCRDPAFVIAVENKIDSGEHGDQLQRYEDAVGAEFAGFPPFFVFLTPGGDEPTEKDWMPYSYSDIHRVLTRVKRTAGGSLGGDVAVFLDHYLNLIGSRLMDDPKIDELCRRIYSNHRRAIDMIVERIEDEVDAVIRSVRQWVETQGESLRVTGGRRRNLEFSPVSWISAVPAIGLQGERKAWLHFWLGPFDGKLRLELAAESSRDEPLRRRILERLTREPQEFGLRLSGNWGDGSRRCLWTRNIAPLNESTPADELLKRTLKAVADALDRLQGLPDVVRATLPA